MHGPEGSDYENYCFSPSLGPERIAKEKGFFLYGASCARFDELQTTMIDEIAFWVKFRER